MINIQTKDKFRVYFTNSCNSTIIYPHERHCALLHKKDLLVIELVNFLMVARGTALAAVLMASHKIIFDVD